ncbi:MAG: ATP-dependent Clp protease ATP-binding subunit [Burkholderiales bacterium]|nr:ATP-dependent Clp protease ATP-binding subunit [Burkholderiales bacterium]
MEYVIIAGAIALIFLLAARSLKEMGRRARTQANGAAAGGDTPATTVAAGGENAEDKPQTSVEPPPSATLQDLASTLEPAYESSGHPEVLTQHPAFRRGVELLRDPATPLDLVIDGCIGANVQVAAMAAAALREREDSALAVPDIVDYVRHANVWTLFFILRFLALRAREPVVARVLLQVREWWPRNPLLMRFLAEFVDARIAIGERVDLRGTLAEHGCEQPAELAMVLSRLSPPHADDLRVQQQRFERERVDVVFLSGIGRIWREDNCAGALLTPAFETGMGAALTVLHARPPQSLLVVGEPGVGKTSFVRCLAQRLIAQGWTLFEASAAEIIAGQAYIGDLEGRMHGLLAAVGSERRVLWYIPAFHETHFAGRHRYSPTGLLDLMLPAIESGRVCILGETHPASLEKLLQQRPRLRNLMQTLRLEPASTAETLALAARVFPQHGPDAAVEPGLLEEALELARNYLTALVPPGNVLDLLRQTRVLLPRGGGAPPIGREELLAAVVRFTGLPQAVVDEREGLDAAGLRTFLQRRVMGQPEAVSCLVDRIAMLKAGLTDPRRPIGVFLFAGPTGTGKTEVAKTLAEYLFGSTERMIRLDMSEFQEPHSLSRILGDAGEDGETQSLVTRIRRQPFSVLLLDEFEKAHPRIWDLFLQVFDDGRLTDAQGNLADFRHCIVILTSNLGATEHRGTSLGFTRGEGDFGGGQILRAIAATFRPEFVNRIDRVVVFRPLSRSVMRDILRKELRAVLERRGFRNRDWAVEWEESAIEFLLDRGFTRDMGARPLRRAIDEHVLAPIAMTIVENRFPEGDQFLFVRGAADRIEVEFVDPDAPADAAAPAAHDGLSYARIILSPGGSRQERAFLEDGHAGLQARIEAPAWTARKQELLQAMAHGGFWDDPDRHAVLAALENLDSIEAGLANAQSLARRLQARPGQAGVPVSILGNLAQQLCLIERAFADHDATLAPEVFVGIDMVAEDSGNAAAARRWSERVMDMYRDWARKRRVRFTMLRTDSGGDDTGHIAAVVGFGVHGVLAREAGMHVWETPDLHGGFDRCTARVRVVAQPAQPLPPGRDAAAFAAQCLAAARSGTTIVRRYREQPSPLVRDAVAGWRTGRLDQVLGGDFDLVA